LTSIVGQGTESHSYCRWQHRRLTCRRVAMRGARQHEPSRRHTASSRTERIGPADQPPSHGAKLMGSVLIVDDEPNIRRMLGALLAAEGYEVRDAPDGVTALAVARETAPDAVLLDLMMPGALDGLGTLLSSVERDGDLPVIMMSGRAGLSDAVRATKLGAFNFLEKPLSPETILLALGAALELRRRAPRGPLASRGDGPIGPLVGTSAPMQLVGELIARVGPSDSRVLITGESGTGKELVAAAIHAASLRRDRPFIRVNCAAIPRDLVESEMFGHERARSQAPLTGASADSSWPIPERSFSTRWATSEPRHRPNCSARSRPRRSSASGVHDRSGRMSASWRPPTRISRARWPKARSERTSTSVSPSFRWHCRRCATVRRYPGACPTLASQYRARTGRTVAAWGPDAMQRLATHRWPGNVRELANIVERIAILHAGSIVTEADVRMVLPLDASARPIGAAQPPGVMRSTSDDGPRDGDSPPRGGASDRVPVWSAIRRRLSGCPALGWWTRSTHMSDR